MRSLELAAVEKLEETTSNLRRTTTAKVYSAIRKGVDYEEIIAYATELNAELIVIATHGRTGVLHTLLGSVAEKIIRYSKIPVLVTTPDQSDN
jgi:nucleotide-binding universal stress UspA family protein